MSSAQQILGLSLNFLIPAVVGGVIARILPLARGQGKEVGVAVGNLVVDNVNRAIDPALRPLVIAEFASVANEVEMRSQTVLETATALLARVIPQVPTATISQVAQIVAEFVKTFEAGLSDTFDAAVHTAALEREAIVTPKPQ